MTLPIDTQKGNSEPPALEALGSPFCQLQQVYEGSKSFSNGLMSIAGCRQGWSIAICLFDPLRSPMAIGINSSLSHTIDHAAVIEPYTSLPPDFARPSSLLHTYSYDILSRVISHKYSSIPLLRLLLLYNPATLITYLLSHISTVDSILVPVRELTVRDLFVLTPYSYEFQFATVLPFTH